MNVLRFDISVHNAVLVEVVHGGDQLFDDVCGLDFVELTVHQHSLIQSTTMHHLIHEVDLLLVFKHLNNLADVRVVKLLEEFNLFEQFSSLTELEILLTDDLDGASDARNLVDTAADTGKSSLTDSLMEVVVVLDVVLVAKVELFWVELDSVGLVGRVVCAVLQHVFKVLSAESDHFFGLLAHDLLDEVLKDAWECIGDLDLLGREDSHLSHVCHLDCFLLSV